MFQVLNRCDQRKGATATVEFAGEPYGAGDIVVIGTETPHRFTAIGDERLDMVYWKPHELPNVRPKDYRQLSQQVRPTLRRVRRRPTPGVVFWKQASLFE